VLDTQRAAFAGIAATGKPGAEIELLWSSTGRDAASNGLVLDERSAACLVKRYAASGLRVEEWRPASTADVTRLSSGWGQRLGIPTRRQAWVYRLRVLKL